jgi:site-specific DNA-methyltransferase (adenine-specific)
MGVVLQGNSLEVLKQFSDGAFDATITDPPYNIGGGSKSGLKWEFSSHVTIKEVWDVFSNDGFFEFTFNWLKQVIRTTKQNGNILIFGSDHNAYLTGFLLKYLFKLRIVQTITWFKPNAQPNITGRLLTESTERIIWVCNAPAEEAKGWHFDYDAAKNINGGKQLRNLWQMPYASVAEKEFGPHPAQKPEALLERLVTLFTTSTAHVLDPFAGSGTTAVACKRLGRDYTMIEQDAQYINLIGKRLEWTSSSLSF